MQRITLRIILILFGILLLLTVSCTRAEKSTLDFPDMNFQVDADCLDSMRTAREFGVQFAPPKGWNALPDGVVGQMREGMKGKREGELPEFELQYSFVKQDSIPHVFMLSSIARNGDEAFPAMVQRYNKLFKAFLPEAETTTNSVSGIKCWQSRRIMNGMAFFRILMETKPAHPWLQIDVVYPAAQSADIGRVLESAIGTVRLI